MKEPAFCRELQQAFGGIIFYNENTIYHRFNSLLLKLISGVCITFSPVTKYQGEILASEGFLRIRISCNKQ